VLQGIQALHWEAPNRVSRSIVTFEEHFPLKTDCVSMSMFTVRKVIHALLKHTHGKVLLVKFSPARQLEEQDDTPLLETLLPGEESELLLEALEQKEDLLAGLGCIERLVVERGAGPGEDMHIMNHLRVSDVTFGCR